MKVSHWYLKSPLDYKLKIAARLCYRQKNQEIFPCESSFLELSRNGKNFTSCSLTYLVIDHCQPVDERHWMHEVCEVDIGSTHHPEPGETVVERVGPWVAHNPSSRTHRTTIRGLFQVQPLAHLLDSCLFHNYRLIQKQWGESFTGQDRDEEGTLDEGTEENSVHSDERGVWFIQWW